MLFYFVNFIQDSKFPTERMSFVEWGSGKMVDIECRNFANGCVKRWYFEDKNMTLLDNGKTVTQLRQTILISLFRNHLFLL